MPGARIAVAALIPHGGEGGLLGREEIEAIGPAVDAARASGINAAGPLPADSVFNRAIGGEFDAVLAMYHDQGHIAIKVHDFHHSVTATLGIPLIRTSVDHGTAFDIAGSGIADATGCRGRVTGRGGARRGYAGQLADGGLRRPGGDHVRNHLVGRIGGDRDAADPVAEHEPDASIHGFLVHAHGRKRGGGLDAGSLGWQTGAP